MNHPPLILLAGTSEAGKSSAGVHLESAGARRIKIRTVLLQLTSGRVVLHEGIATRENFDPADFVAHMLRVGSAADEPVLVVESFIDAALAETLKRAWPNWCVTIFITAPMALRVARLAEAEQLDLDLAEQTVRHKDDRKRVEQQHTAWQRTADHWIDNTGDLGTLHARLDAIFVALRSLSGGASP